MTLMRTLARGGDRLRALLLVGLSLAFGACDGADRLTNSSDTPATVALNETLTAPTALSLSSNFRGGIPFGFAHVPKEEYGSLYSGSLANISASELLSYLELASRSGAKIILSFSGSETNYRNSNLSFSMTKWKQRVDRYRGIDFSAYIADGTIVGHYLMDEPHDPTNWGGRLVSPATVDEMAKYSKQLWPTLPTLVRSWPAYLKGYNYQYLDAAWAQYSERKGEIGEFVRSNVRDAKAAGLALVVGLNVLDGGTKASGIKGNTNGKYAMSASQMIKWGGALLDDSYACAFISWKYDDKYLARSDIKSAVASLSQKAQGHASTSCAVRTQAAPPPVVQPPVVQPPVDEPPVVEPPVTQPPVSQPPDNQPPVNQPPLGQPAATPSIALKVAGRVQGSTQLMTLTWSGATGSSIDVYRDGALRKSTENDGYYVNSRKRNHSASYVYKVCQRQTSICSNEVTIALQ